METEREHLDTLWASSRYTCEKKRTWKSFLTGGEMAQSLTLVALAEDIDSILSTIVWFTANLKSNSRGPDTVL